MTISIAELPALSKEDMELQSDMLQRMRDLAKQVSSANANVSSINSLTGSNLDNILNIFKVQIEQTVNNQGYEEDKRNLQTFMDQYMNKTQENMEE